LKLASFESLAAALEVAGVRYLVAGGLAVGAHGYLRFTKDVDIVVQLIPDNIERAFTALSSLGYRPIVLFTVRGETRIPSFSSSPLAMRSSPDEGSA
jgi:hypothetical protein